MSLKRYGVADGMAWEVGLPCGGDIVVLIQRIDETGFPASLFAEIAKAQAGGRTLVVSTNIETGASAVGNGGFANVYAPPRRLLIVAPSRLPEHWPKSRATPALASLS